MRERGLAIEKTDKRQRIEEARRAEIKLREVHCVGGGLHYVVRYVRLGWYPLTTPHPHLTHPLTTPHPHLSHPLPHSLPHTLTSQTETLARLQSDLQAEEARLAQIAKARAEAVVERRAHVQRTLSAVVVQSKMRAFVAR